MGFNFGPKRSYNMFFLNLQQLQNLKTSHCVTNQRFVVANNFWLSNPWLGREDRQNQKLIGAFSRTFYLSRLKSKQRIGAHRQEVLDLIVGNLLGDGYAERRGNSTRIILKQSLQKINYIHHLHKIMSDGGVCNPNPPRAKTSLAKSGKLYYSAKFATYSFSSFNHIHESFYGQRDDNLKFSKKVPDEIAQLLTPRALAHWIMDDGSLYKNLRGAKRGPDKSSIYYGGLRMSTESFNFEEISKLQEALFYNFSLKSTVHKHKMESGDHKPVLYLGKAEVKRVYNLVSPYFEKNMLYKIKSD